MMNRLWNDRFAACAIGLILIGIGHARAASPALLGHWKLNGDARDYSGHANHGRNHGTDLAALAPRPRSGRTARFDGRDDYVEVDDSPSLALGTSAFSIAAWVHTAAELDDVLGDLANKYSPQSRKGFVLSIKHNVGGTTSQANYRHVQFGIDNGKLFVGTLPSGHVLSLEAGKSVTLDRALPSGWVHLVAVKSSDRLKLFINGELMATSAPFNAADYDISNRAPLRIGFGPHDYLNGCLSDVRLYARALSDAEIKELRTATAQPAPPATPPVRGNLQGVIDKLECLQPHGP